VLRWLRVIWETVEPFLALSTLHGRIAAVAFLLSITLLVWKRQWHRRRYITTQSKLGPLGENPSLLSLCEYLHHLILESASFIQDSTAKAVDASEIARDLREDILRVYFFGHQKAGKSSLVNALLGEIVSPAFPGKLTACLVRVRNGSTARMIERWDNGTTEIGSLGSLKKRMARWVESEERPREVIVEIQRDILGSRKTELVDSPGTGSAWNNKHGLSLEDEMVNVAVRSAAIVVVVYRYAAGDVEAHDNLMRQLGMNNVPTVAVCNLDPNWADELAHSSRDIEITIDRAEARLRNLSRAKCYRIAVKGDSNLLRLARRAGGDTVDELRSYLVNLLGDRKALGILQAVRKGHTLIEELFQDTRDQILANQGLFDETERKRLELLDAIHAVRAVLNAGYERGYMGTATGATIGGALGVVGAASAAAVLTVATAGVFLAFVAAGAGLGYIADQRARWRFEKQLGQTWTNLQRCATNTNLVSRAMSKKVSSSTPSEYYCASVLDELDTDLAISLQQMEGYEIYRRSKALEAQLHELWSLFQAHNRNAA
jgi:preprotein translocase subunit SecG/GTPase SAR1 family protein